MSITLWLSLCAACLILSLSPGAGAVNTMTTSILYGWKRSFFTIVGQQLALVAQIAVVATGLGVIVANSPSLFNLIRYGGAAYLAYLGLRLIFARVEVERTHSTSQVPVKRSRFEPGSSLDLVGRGFWVNMSNPKAIVFMVAFMPQFIRPDQPQLPQYLVLAATMVAIDVAVMWGGFAVVAKPLTRLSHSPRGQKVLNLIFGSLFVLVALLMIFAIH